MKAPYFILTILLLAGMQFLQAQITTSGVAIEDNEGGATNISGNLGVGVNPLSKFHVKYNGTNGASGLSGYAILAEADSGQATLGAEGQGDIYANLNLGTNISGTRRFWHISKRKSNANHNLHYYFYNGLGFDGPLFTFSTNGNLGVGVNPSSKFHVKYNGTNGASGLSGYAILAEADSGQATLGAEGQGDIYANLNLGTNISGTRRFWHISKRKSNANHNLHYYFYNGLGFDGPLFTFSTNGNLGIGITNPTEKLHVNGKIRATGQVGWPDYVFHKDYQLPKLTEVESHIKEKGHLKDIPSEKEVLKNGIDLTDMDSKLLQKIEELTLYLIQQNKELQTQKAAIEKLKELLEKE